MRKGGKVRGHLVDSLKMADLGELGERTWPERSEQELKTDRGQRKELGNERVWLQSGTEKQIVTRS